MSFYLSQASMYKVISFFPLTECAASEKILQKIKFWTKVILHGIKIVPWICLGIIYFNLINCSFLYMALVMEIFRGRLKFPVTFFSIAFIILYKCIIHSFCLSLLRKIPSSMFLMWECSYIPMLLFPALILAFLILIFNFSNYLLFFPHILNCTAKRKWFLPAVPSLNNKSMIRMTCGIA